MLGVPPMCPACGKARLRHDLDDQGGVACPGYYDAGKGALLLLLPVAADLCAGMVLTDCSAAGLCDWAFTMMLL